jgi:hypothetical protein
LLFFLLAAAAGDLRPPFAPAKEEKESGDPPHSKSGRPHGEPTCVE